MEEIISVPRTDIVQTNFLTQTESIMQEVVKTKNFDVGFQFVREVYEMKKTLDNGAGVVLNGMSEAWVPSEHEGESFEQAALRMTGLSPDTVRRHLKIQHAFALIPEEFREEIQEMPVKSTIQIAELVEKKFPMTSNDWLRLAEAPDEREVGRIARAIKGAEPRSNWMSFVMDEDGRIFVNTNKGSKELTRLPVDSDDPEIQKAIDKIVSRSKIKHVVRY